MRAATPAKAGRTPPARATPVELLLLLLPNQAQLTNARRGASGARQIPPTPRAARWWAAATKNVCADCECRQAHRVFAFEKPKID
eukprot:12020977-Alexandrium_andersonii.AAC.1